MNQKEIEKFEEAAAEYGLKPHEHNWHTNAIEFRYNGFTIFYDQYSQFHISTQKNRSLNKDDLKKIMKKGYIFIGKTDKKISTVYPMRKPDSGEEAILYEHSKPKCHEIAVSSKHALPILSALGINKLPQTVDELKQKNVELGIMC